MVGVVSPHWKKTSGTVPNPIAPITISSSLVFYIFLAEYTSSCVCLMQLRVHCAEVLGTPIVGDYKYGWQAHRNWKPFPHNSHKNQGKKQSLPFGLDFESGSIAENNPRLHLHCKHLTLPDVSCALHNDSLDHDCSRLERLELDAPLPSYMQRSWDIINN